MARAVAASPSILLLDEPAAGLDDRETRELGAVIRGLATRLGMGILLIEHDVELAMSICDRIYALDFGRQIAVGTPSEIRESPAVVAAYLGEPPTADAAAASDAPAAAGAPDDATDGDAPAEAAITRELGR